MLPYLSRSTSSLGPMLRRVPVGVSLAEHSMLGLAGPPNWLGGQLAWVLVQAATMHSPDELPVVVIAPGAAEADLGWMRWLPHARPDSGDVVAAWSDDAAEELVRALADRLRERAEASRQYHGAALAGLLVVLVGTDALCRRSQLADLLVRGPSLGFRFVCAETDPRLLPDGCRTRLVAEAGGSAVLHVDQAGATPVLPDVLPDGAADIAARTLAPIRRTGVADDVDSTDVIGSGAAARILKNTPGRAYVKRGDSSPELVQTARITTPVAGSARRRAPRVTPVRWSQAAAPAPPKEPVRPGDGVASRP